MAAAWAMETTSRPRLSVREDVWPHISKVIKKKVLLVRSMLPID